MGRLIFIYELVLDGRSCLYSQVHLLDGKCVISIDRVKRLTYTGRRRKVALDMDIQSLLKFYRNILLLLLYWIHGAMMRSITTHSNINTQISTPRVTTAGRDTVVFQNVTERTVFSNQKQNLASSLYDDVDLQYLTSSNPTELFEKVQTYNRRIERFRRDSGVSGLSEDNRKQCCPTVSKRIKLLGGITKDRKPVRLFNSPNSTQRFYVTECHRDFRNKKCQFIEPRYADLSYCLTLKSWTYAVVRDVTSNSDSDWRVDYIQYNSGCTCKMRHLLPEDRESSQV